jgi:hypothetical protein
MNYGFYRNFDASSFFDYSKLNTIFLETVSVSAPKWKFVEELPSSFAETGVGCLIHNFS